MDNSISLKSLFNSLQQQMTVQLSTNREVIPHPGSKGDSLENVWIDWLKKYLPNRYQVDKAIVIDSKGKLSHQLDLVIYDQQYTPFVFSQNGVSYIPAEGVYAVFEVKPNLKKDYIEYAGDKIQSVRQLYRTSTSIIDVGQVRYPRPLTQILGGILTSVSDLKQKETIKNHLKNIKGLGGIDLACSVDFATFYVDYKDIYEPEKDRDIDEKNQDIQEYYENREVREIIFSEKDNSLVTFFLQLMRYLQQSIGTVAAIDLQAYSNAIGFKIDNQT